MAIAKMYGLFRKSAYGSTTNLLSDDIRIMLCTSSYVPNADTHQYKDISITNEVVGTGYTASGIALASKTLTYIGSSTANAWIASTAYTYGQTVRPTTANGHIYVCTIVGNSSSSAPTFPTTSGATVSDGSVTWKEVGSGYTVFNASTVNWSSFTSPSRYAVIYDNTPATNKPLIAYVDFVTDQFSSSGITITWDGLGIFSDSNN